MLSPAFAICSCRGCDNPPSTTTKGSCEGKTKQGNDMQTLSPLQSQSQSHEQSQRQRSPSPSPSPSPSSSPSPQSSQRQQQFGRSNHNDNNSENTNIRQKNLGSYILSRPFFSKGMGQKSYSYNDLQTTFAMQTHERDLDQRHSSQSSSYDSFHSLQHGPFQLAQFYEHYLHPEKPLDTKLAHYRAYYSNLFYHDDPHNHNYNHNHDHTQANKGYFDAISSWFPLASKR